MRTFILSLLMVGGIYAAACSNTSGNTGASLDAVPAPSGTCPTGVTPADCNCLFNLCLNYYTQNQTPNGGQFCGQYFVSINSLCNQVTASEWMTCAVGQLNNELSTNYNAQTSCPTN